MPGIVCEVLKRPHDLALRLLVQDLCLVDRIQNFGPEYELVVCSSGRSLLGFSPPPASNEATPTATPTASGSSSKLLKQTASMMSVSSELFREDCSGQGSLLTLTYTLIQPHSPEHPVMLEAEEEGAGKGEGPDFEGAAVMHCINVQCTAVDAIGESAETNTHTWK